MPATIKERAEEIKRQAIGQWYNILVAAGIPAESLQPNEVPCPKCNGNTRFRTWEHFYHTGGVRCSHCHKEHNGDGISAIRWWFGITPTEAIEWLENHLGISSANGKGATYTPAPAKQTATQAAPAATRDPFKHIVELPWSDLQAALFCQHKPGVTPAGLIACGASIVRYRQQWPAIGLPIIGENGEKVGWALWPMNGKTLPTYYKDPQTGKIKTDYVPSLITSGSGNGWIGQTDKLAAATHVWKVEGLSDVAALAGFGLPAGHVAITNKSGCGQDPAKSPWMLEQLAGKTVYVLHDCDKPGQEGATQVPRNNGDFRPGWAPSIAAYATECRNIVLPYPIAETHGPDLRDWIDAGGTVDQLIAFTIDANTAAPAPVISIPEIMVGPDEERVNDEAIAALAQTQGIYQRGNDLVRVVKNVKPPRGIERPADAPRISAFSEPTLRERLATVATWWRMGKEDRERIHPPGWSVKGVAARGHWHGILPLEAVVESPILRPDGSILQTPGYDHLSGVLFHPAQKFDPIPDNPNWDDVDNAVLLLREMLCDFPFPSEAYRSAAIAGVITPFARMAFSGPAPLILVDSNVRGTGKGKLVNAMTSPFLGREVARMTAPSNDDEARKRITSIAIAGETVILIDNIGGPLGGPALDSALTATTWNDRKLGSSEMTGNMPLIVTWYATGNNIMLKADTARRCLHVRMESPYENPEERDDFTHEDLDGWIRESRSKLVAAALTILRGYCVAGRPPMSLSAWGSFEGWSGLVRQAIHWAGLADPGDTRKELAKTSDSESSLLKQLVAGWEEVDVDGVGITVADALWKLDNDRDGNRYPIFRAALEEINRGKINAKSIGMKIHHLRGRLTNGKFFQRLETETNRGAVWKIERQNSEKLVSQKTA